MQLSMEYLRARGTMPWVVERRIPITLGKNAPDAFKGKTPSKLVDLFAVFDLVFIDRERHQVGFVQTTSWNNRRAHILKMEAQADVMFALAVVPGAVTELHAWRKIEGRWEVKVWRTAVEYGPDQKDHAILTEWAMPSMKEARAEARERERGDEDRRVRRI
jgi:hypothetical protein